ncbi:MAG: hypothetical protein A2Y94_02120 [Caldithrix sp. RBG_13_44_9]|nr:MAG: hypothetical protein A2Y94_02120 [Caldithrix sp. RBG_13_44_9]
MKRFTIVVLLLLFVISLSSVFAQSRKPQIELFGGVAIPLAPDGFKDYYKMGFSGHGQYVIFPSPKLGVSFGAAYEKFTFDGDKLLEDFGLAGLGLDVTGSASVIELGVGLRPYLTPVESNTQMFLFGMGTYNFIKSEATISYQGLEESYSDDLNKFGLAAGAGLELPAGTSMNIILQGVFRFIFTSDEEMGGTTQFVGITAGLAF